VSIYFDGSICKTGCRWFDPTKRDVLLSVVVKEKVVKGSLKG